MSILDGFELLNAPEIPFITISKYGITFSKASIEQLHKSLFVHAYLKAETKQFAVKPCDFDQAALEFVNPEKPDPNFIRWGNRQILRRLVKIAGVNVNLTSFRVNGKYFQEEDLIIYDLSSYQAVN